MMFFAKKRCEIGRDGIGEMFKLCIRVVYFNNAMYWSKRSRPRLRKRFPQAAIHQVAFAVRQGNAGVMSNQFLQALKVSIGVFESLCQY